MRELFLLDPSVTFLNHGSFGACPVEVFEVYQHWQRELERQPVDFFIRRSESLLRDARETLAAYLGAPADCIAYVDNATFGVNTVARSLPLAAGDEVLTTDHEYGACEFALMQVCEERGARYIRQPIPLPLPSPAEFLERFWQAVTPRTRVIFLSHITSPTGLIFPIEPIIRRAREHGILTLIDGAHAPGQIPLDLTALGADFYTGNCHKWLCAPKGAAFLYARPEHHALLHGLVIGWAYLPERTGSEPREPLFVRRHQNLGTRDLAAFLAVPAAIAFQQAHDWDQVRARCRALARETTERICALSGLTPIAGADQHRQLSAIPLPDCDPQALYRYLWQDNRIEIPITAQANRHYARISIQGYNTPADASALIDALSVYFDWCTSAKTW
jgi:isopenicillin-N epimerase